MGGQQSVQAPGPAHSRQVPPMGQHSSAYGYQMAQMYGGHVARAGSMNSYNRAQDLLGRSDLQVLQSSAQSHLPNIAGNAAAQISAVAYGARGYSEIDILPHPGMARFNRFQNFDTRGDPPHPDASMYERDASVLQAVRWGGSDEFLQKSLADVNAPLPSINMWSNPDPGMRGEVF